MVPSTAFRVQRSPRGLPQSRTGPKEFDRGHYAKTLRLIQRAQNWGALTDDKRAEFAYLKARSLERQGDASAARQLYRYLLEQHPTSEYAYLAMRRDPATTPAEPTKG
ncbi:MAG: hypothetical protein AAGG11_24720 [Pseudomonadota bacterium]